MIERAAANAKWASRPTPTCCDTVAAMDSPMPVTTYACLAPSAIVDTQSVSKELEGYSVVLPVFQLCGKVLHYHSGKLTARPLEAIMAVRPTVSPLVQSGAANRT